MVFQQNMKITAQDSLLYVTHPIGGWLTSLLTLKTRVCVLLGIA
jgi:hypothetical protein